MANAAGNEHDPRRPAQITAGDCMFACLLMHGTTSLLFAVVVKKHRDSAVQRLGTVPPRPMRSCSTRLKKRRMARPDAIMRPISPARYIFIEQTVVAAPTDRQRTRSPRPRRPKFMAQFCDLANCIRLRAPQQ